MALTNQEKKYLLRAAREAIEQKVETREEDGPETDSLSEALREKRGAFVTLKSNGQLRGCIGTFSEEKPLSKTVTEMAVSAATHDPRFMPVTPEELKRLKIEISALTPLTPIKGVTEIEVGRHGIYILKEGSAGVLLPQVATENNLSREEFLEMLCQKAGLGPGQWREGATILTFEAEIFSETELFSEEE